MDAYISKPFKPRVLEACLDGYLALHTPADSNTGQPPMPGGACASAAGESNGLASASAPPLDMAAFQKLTAGDVKFQRELIATFIQVGQQANTEIARAVSQQDLESVARIAHRLKGNGGYLSAMQLKRCAEELEAVAKGRSGDSLEALAGQLRAEVSRLITFFRTL
jgi:HPt (histidine-containing phosphotransfer) domain-containing protein